MNEKNNKLPTVKTELYDCPICDEVVDWEDTGKRINFNDGCCETDRGWIQISILKCKKCGFEGSTD